MVFCSMLVSVALQISFGLIMDWTNLTSISLRALSTASQAGSMLCNCCRVLGSEMWVYLQGPEIMRQIRMHNILKSQDLALLEYMFWIHRTATATKHAFFQLNLLQASHIGHQSYVPELIISNRSIEECCRVGLFKHVWLWSLRWGLRSGWWLESPVEQISEKNWGCGCLFHNIRASELCLLPLKVIINLPQK